MVLHLASEQWVMIERKRLDLKRYRVERKTDDDNDDDEEEVITSFSNCSIPSIATTSSSFISKVN